MWLHSGGDEHDHGGGDEHDHGGGDEHDHCDGDEHDHSGGDEHDNCSGIHRRMGGVKIQTAGPARFEAHALCTPMVVTGTVAGDIFAAKWDIDLQFIAHQANCVSRSAKGFSAALFSRFPWADIYAQREAHSKPGGVTIKWPPPDGDSARFATPAVIHIFGQWAIGTPGRWNARYARSDEERAIVETKAQRAEWFAEALRGLDAMKLPGVVAVPYGIGCGLADGDWPTYLKMLEDASTRFAVYRLS